MTFFLPSAYEQRHAAEYFEKILCLTSPKATRVLDSIFLWIFLYVSESEASKLRLMKKFNLQ